MINKLKSKSKSKSKHKMRMKKKSSRSKKKIKSMSPTKKKQRKRTIKRKRKKRSYIDGDFDGKEDIKIYDIITLEKCTSSEKLLKFIKDEEINYYQIEIKQNETEKKQICKDVTKHETFPIIFHNGILIGGFEKFIEFIDSLKKIEQIYLKIYENEKKNDKRCDNI